MDLVIQCFIFIRPNLKVILQDHQSLGAHTSIIDISANAFTKYTWVHVGSRPFGESFVRQCPTCLRLQFKPPKFQGDSRIIYECKYINPEDGEKCHGKHIFDMPAGAFWVYDKPPGKGDSRGTWMGLREKIFNDDGENMKAD
jgi:hypothetical protein